MNMKGKNLIIGVVALMILVGFLIYNFGGNVNDENNKSELIDSCDNELCEGVLEIINANLPPDYKVQEINHYERSNKDDIKITLACEEISYETEEIVIGILAELLFESYPNEFGLDLDRMSSVDILGCSETGTSPDGEVIYMHKTNWGIFNGQFSAAE
jgi:hypothetical protein